MTMKPKTRKAPAKLSAVWEAIARAKAAQAAYDAAPDHSDETLIPLSTAESDACDDLAEAHCRDDAEFVEKLRYLFAREVLLFGKEDNAVMVAVATHLKGRKSA
jgi:hypothetical protein